MSEISQVFEAVDMLIVLARCLKIKESKAFDYQMYSEIFVDLSIWQVVTKILSRQKVKINLDILYFG